MDNKDFPLCSCGCGQNVSNKNSKFIRGHWLKGNKHALGRKDTEELKKKKSERMKGNKIYLNRKEITSEEIENRKNRMIENKYNLGHKDTDDTRRKKSIGHKNISPERIEKIRSSMKGNKYSSKGDVTKLKIPLYDTYANQLIEWDPGEEIRRDPNDKKLLQVKCKYENCKKWFSPNRDQVVHRIQCLKSQSRGSSNFYCCDEHKKQCSIYKKHFYPEGFRPNTRSVQYEWKSMIIERDGLKCNKCGSSIGPFIAHHKDPVVCNPLESADIDIGEILCKNCHNSEHQKDDISLYNLSKFGRLKKINGGLI